MMRTLLAWSKRMVGRAAGVDWAVLHVDEPPSPPKRGIVYVTGGSETPYQAVMKCPCGCTDVIWLDLTDFGEPFWALNTGRWAAASLNPSVWCTDGCGSHFWLRGGKIEWCEGRMETGWRKWLHWSPTKLSSER